MWMAAININLSIQTSKNILLAVFLHYLLTRWKSGERKTKLNCSHNFKSSLEKKNKYSHSFNLLPVFLIRCFCSFCLFLTLQYIVETFCVSFGFAMSVALFLM